MDTSLRLATIHANEQAVQCSADIEAFLSQLTAEQTRFLAAVGDAARGLDSRSGQIAAVAAIHTRLAQQFLDAQRSIIRRRAETDARVARIDADADFDASEIAANAMAHVAGVTMPIEDLWAAYSNGELSTLQGATVWPAPVEAASFPFRPVYVTQMPMPASGPSVRQQIAELGTSVVRTRDEAESLARVIDEAFEIDEPDGALAKRQLGALLDEWWRAENQDSNAAIDDANARAAMRIHLAHVTGREIASPTRATVDRSALPSAPVSAVASLLPPVVVSPAERVMFLAPPVAGSSASRMLPESVTTALDATDHVGLDAVLASLLDSLEPQPAAIERVPEIPAPTDMAPTHSQLVTPEGPQDTFDRFWGHFVKGSPSRPRRDWIVVQVLLPAVAVVAVIALVLAVVG